ncbi:MAG: hypothetical protein HAW59_01855 [Betaproteobacteria bacterium]|nr:hypothetical protein [Betaproteobacteria bacterium]
MVPNSANSMCENPTPTTCGVNEMQAPNGIGCVCATGFTGNPGACVQTPTTCGVNEMQAPNGIGCVCATGFTGNPGACVQIPPPAPPAANNDSDEKRTEAVIGIMGIALFGILYNGGLTGGGEFGLTPDYTFAHNSGVMIHSYGGRLDYAADNFSAYYAAKKTAASGFVYSAGMEYAKDFYNLAYNAKSEGDNTAANIAAGLKWQSGILQYQSGITAEYELTKIADDFSAYWNNAAELKYQGWKITPSANIYFRQGEEFGDNINLRLNLRREF